MVFEALEVSRGGAVLFAENRGPLMNLAGPEPVRDLVSLIQRAEADAAVQGLSTIRSPPCDLAHTTADCIAVKVE